MINFNNVKEHSKFADDMKDQFSLWIKVKDRNLGDSLRGNILDQIGIWANDHNILCEWNSRFNRYPHMEQIRLAHRFYLGIFPKNESEMNAVKIVWGEYLSNREIQEECFFA